MSDATANAPEQSSQISAAIEGSLVDLVPTAELFAQETTAIELEGAPLQSAVEALLFVSDEPVSAATLAKLLDKNPSSIDAVLQTLANEYEEQERGIQLREVAGGWRLYSHPAFHEVIEQYVLSWDTRSLSQAALEALAVVAYHQPCTRAGLNGIRGVNSDGVIASLMEKGLVREMGRDPGPGNAILYGTTRTFLEKFGLKSLKELPLLEDFAPDERSKQYIRNGLSARGSSEETNLDTPASAPAADKAAKDDWVPEDAKEQETMEPEELELID